MKKYIIFETYILSDFNSNLNAQDQVIRINFSALTSNMRPENVQEECGLNPPSDPAVQRVINHRACPNMKMAAFVTRMSSVSFSIDPRLPTLASSGGSRLV